MLRLTYEQKLLDSALKCRDPLVVARLLVVASADEDRRRGHGVDRLYRRVGVRAL